MGEGRFRGVRLFPFGVKSDLKDPSIPSPQTPLDPFCATNFRVLDLGRCRRVPAMRVFPFGYIRALLRSVRNERSTL